MKIGLFLSPLLLFKPRKTLEVKGYIFVFLLSLLSLGQDELPSAEVPQERYNNLPDIEAKAYAAKVVRVSKSGRVYLFVLNKDQTLPDESKIILLKKGNTNVMAFRVIKMYVDRNQVAARRVRRYPSYEQLGKGRAFLAYEKIADLIGMEKETEEDLFKDQEDLGELEETMPADKQGDDVFFDDFGEEESVAEEEPLNDEDVEDDFFDESDDIERNQQDNFQEEGFNDPVDETIPVEGPIEEESVVSEFEDTKEKPKKEKVDFSDITVDRITASEEKFFDRHNNDLTLGTGLFNAPNTSTGGTALRIGFGIQYGFNIGRKVFASSNSTQDSFTLEGGLYTYKVLNFLSAGDSYTVFPLFAKVRYNLMFSPSFWIYGQIGLLKNGVLAGAQGSADEADFNNAVASLGRFLPVVGVGTMIQMGPHWYFRTDLGLDAIHLGICLRF